LGGDGRFSEIRHGVITDLRLTEVVAQIRSRLGRKPRDITALMRWFRDTIRQGTWLALIALAINLGLSFGHFHAIDGKASGRGIAAVAASIASPDDGQKQGNPDDSHADYLCPICMAATAMASALAPAPPALPLEFNNVTIDRTVVSVLVLVEPPRAAFQSRGPPIS
jgi:S1-C subfamily serine protease